MMQLTINIPKELYEDIQRRSNEIQADGDTLENAVLNGIPISEEHDDLKDIIDTGWIDFQTETVVKADKGDE